jgi:hypothetical protein
MNRKRRFDSWFRGWIPKEPSPVSSGDQRTRAKSINGIISTLSTRTIGGLALCSLLSGFAILAAPYYLFPGSYTSKANSVWGYSEPATIEAGIILGAAIGLIFLSISAFTLFGVRLKSQGSKWMKYTFWITPGHDGFHGKTLFKITVVANLTLVGALVLFSIYAATMGLIELRYQSMIIFSVLITLVNLFLHEYGKKVPKQKETVS